MQVGTFATDSHIPSLDSKAPADKDDIILCMCVCIYIYIDFVLNRNPLLQMLCERVRNWNNISQINFRGPEAAKENSWAIETWLGMFETALVGRLIQRICATVQKYSAKCNLI